MINSRCFCVFVLLIYTFILFTQRTKSENFPLFEKRGLKTRSTKTYSPFFLLLALFSPRRWGICNRTCNNATWWEKLRTASDSSQKAGGDVSSWTLPRVFLENSNTSRVSKFTHMNRARTHLHSCRVFPRACTRPEDCFLLIVPPFSNVLPSFTVSISCSNWLSISAREEVSVTSFLSGTYFNGGFVSVSEPPCPLVHPEKTELLPPHPQPASHSSLSPSTPLFLAPHLPPPPLGFDPPLQPRWRDDRGRERERERDGIVGKEERKRWQVFNKCGGLEARERWGGGRVLLWWWASHHGGGGGWLPRMKTLFTHRSCFCLPSF